MDKTVNEKRAEVSEVTNKKVIVTGANGFLGSWLTRQLVNDGYSVFALVRKNSDLSELKGVSCEYIYGDVTDKKSLELAFKGMDTVFHLAGLISYRSRDRFKMEQVNIGGTQNVVDTIAELGIRRLVHLSSVVAVGAGFNAKQILNEDSPYNVSHLNLGYFETKHKAELIVKEATLAKRIDSVILNPSTIYGPGDARKGSRGVQLKVAQGRFSFYTSGGVNVVAVEDVVKGIIFAWKKGRTGERYILSGENLLIKDLFSMIAAEAKQKAPPYLLPNWLLFFLGFIGDLANKLGFSTSLSREQAYVSTLYHWFGSEKAQRELNFRPGPAKEAVAKSVKWMAENRLIKNL